MDLESVKTLRRDAPCGNGGENARAWRSWENHKSPIEASFIQGEPRDWDLLSPPEDSFKVGIDGGYVRNWFDKKHKFEIIVGKSIRWSLIPSRISRALL